MKKTTQQRLVEALEKRGFKRIEGKSSKYIVLRANTPGYYYYVGKMGALRVGHNSIKASHPISDRMKGRLLDEVPA